MAPIIMRLGNIIGMLPGMFSDFGHGVRVNFKIRPADFFYPFFDILCDVLTLKCFGHRILSLLSDIELCLIKAFKIRFKDVHLLKTPYKRKLVKIGNGFVNGMGWDCFCSCAKPCKNIYVYVTKAVAFVRHEICLKIIMNGKMIVLFVPVKKIVGKPSSNRVSKNGNKIPLITECFIGLFAETEMTADEIHVPQGHKIGKQLFGIVS